MKSFAVGETKGTITDCHTATEHTSKQRIHNTVRTDLLLLGLWSLQHIKNSQFSELGVIFTDVVITAGVGFGFSNFCPADFAGVFELNLTLTA